MEFEVSVRHLEEAVGQISYCERCRCVVHATSSCEYVAETYMRVSGKRGA